MATREPEGGTGGKESDRRDRPERRGGGERRQRHVGPPVQGSEKRLAERRTGLERRRPHLHYDELTPHPRPERNINDYPLSTDEVEFINAINDYKTKFNRPFPTWSEVLHIMRTLGYIRVDAEFPFPMEGQGPFGSPPEEPEGTTPSKDTAEKKPAE
jgi:hypothetical protein